MRMCGELPGAYAEPPTAVSADASPPPRRQATLPPDAGQSAGRRITRPCLVPAGWLHGQLPVIRFPMTLSGAQFGIALPGRAQFCIVRLRVSLWSAIRCL